MAEGYTVQLTVQSMVLEVVSQERHFLLENCVAQKGLKSAVHRADGDPEVF